MKYNLNGHNPFPVIFAKINDPKATPESVEKVFLEQMALAGIVAESEQDFDMLSKTYTETVQDFLNRNKHGN